MTLDDALKFIREQVKSDPDAVLPIIAETINTALRRHALSVSRYPAPLTVADLAYLESAHAGQWVQARDVVHLPTYTGGHLHGDVISIGRQLGVCYEVRKSGPYSFYLIPGAR